MIHGSSRRLLQSIAASFGVWGYRSRFLRSIMNVIAIIVNHSCQNFETSNLKFSFQSSHTISQLPLSLSRKMSILTMSLVSTNSLTNFAVTFMPVLVPPSSPVQFNKMTNSLTNSLTNPQQAKQPAVAIGTKATLEIATCGSGPGVSYGAMHAPQTVGTMGNFALSIFDPTHSRSDCNTRSKSNACHTW